MKTDSDFLDDFARGTLDANAFFAALRANGVNAFTLPYTLRPDSSQASEHADEGDGAVLMRIEFKRRKLDFTCRADYQYGTVIVDTVRSYDQKTTPWLFYAISNQAASHVALVWWYTTNRWRVATLRDERSRGSRDFYVCPKEAVQFMPIADVFRARAPARATEASTA